ncbi:ubiquitin-associated and SH3 domain-containing protein A [Latimeria chalumnae]|uniref:ubiquitin-associated and SH3 domain-containing protein A n=1 Tax=Latimeria chalumnae TaxID=7897 RepID=UPI00313E697F
MAASASELCMVPAGKLKGRSTFSLLESLLAMGFSELRAHKALAATGKRTSQEAADWLFTHHQDPTLDDPIPQEYMLYLCPSGPLADKLLDFWKESKSQCTKNQAHEIFPHITLTDFFTCEDSKVEYLYEALKKSGDRFIRCFPSSMSLVLHTSSTYIGFFVDDMSADTIKQFAVAFAAEANALADCHVVARNKQIHLTLAHKFYAQHQWTLEQLASAINTKLGCQWTAALYSRDMRFVHYQTLRALFPYTPQNTDELRLTVGENIYVDPTEQMESSDGWVLGISHKTGCRGFLPENYTEKSNESDTWVRHRYSNRSYFIQLFCVYVNFVLMKSWLVGWLRGAISSRSNAPAQTSMKPCTVVTWALEQELIAPLKLEKKLNASTTRRTYTFSETPELPPKKGSEPYNKLPHLGNGESYNTKTTKSVSKILSTQLEKITPSRRRLLIVRHGERVDHVFGKSWLQQCISIEGKYVRSDLNFPSNLPRRNGGGKDFEQDPPLSSCGIFQSRLMGEALLEKEVTVSCVFCSPALRCIETAHHILEGLQLHQRKICIEPGLFEWTKWEASKAIPLFMSVSELRQAKYNVDTSYRVIVPVSSLAPSESYEEYIDRCTVAIQEILTAPNEGTILIVGHASALNSLTRPVLGFPPKDSNDFAQMVRKIPGLGLCCCEELKEEDKWQLIEPPVGTFTHGANSAFSWKDVILDD